MKNQKQKLQYTMLPVYLLDYLFVMFLYISIAIILGVGINGFIAKKYATVDIKIIPTWKLFLLLVGQLFLQGFIVICVIYLLRYIPSPVTGFLGYDPSGEVGTLLRNPAIISILLFTLAVNLKLQLVELYDRATETATIAVTPKPPPAPATKNV